ncbi:MAG: XRE family transcriptional regulator [Chloroflexi bacterium]|nr:MAG: XRE family transcriptional regulator [Chloroflexota bacterium]
MDEHKNEPRVVRVRLREMRERRGLKQSELAQKLDVDRSHICKIEKGIRAPSLSLLHEIARICRCGVSDLLSPGGQS